MSKRTIAVFLLWLLALVAVMGLAASWILGDGRGDLEAVIAAIVFGAGLALVSFLLILRSLGASQQAFNKIFFGGIALRAALILAAVFSVWKWSPWNFETFLVALAITYPLFLVLEAWRAGKEFGFGKTGGDASKA